MLQVMTYTADITFTGSSGIDVYDLGYSRTYWQFTYYVSGNYIIDLGSGDDIIQDAAI